jgi:hypothetical protein
LRKINQALFTPATRIMNTALSAVAVEDLARRQYGKLDTPAAAIMCLALCGSRSLAVHYQTSGNALSSDAAARFLARAPTNVSRLTLRFAWDDVVAALGDSPCHGFLRRLELTDASPVHVDKLLAATSDLAHLRSLRCAGDGVHRLLRAVGGALRRLELPDCAKTAELDFGRLAQLRRIGPVCGLPNKITSIDLSSLRHLVRVDDGFGRKCRELRDVRLPPGVTSIGGGFLEECTSLSAAVLDLSHLTRLQRIGDGFARGSSASDLRLPPSVTSIGSNFLASCNSMAAVLDLNHLCQMQKVNDNFAWGSSVLDVRLPPSVVSIGDHYLGHCSSMRAPLDLSRLTGLQSIGSYCGCDAALTEVNLPPSVATIGIGFLKNCFALGGVLDLSHLALLQKVDDYCAMSSGVADMLLPAGVVYIGYGFLQGCREMPARRKAELLDQHSRVPRF